MGIDLIREAINGLTRKTITHALRIGVGDVFLMPGTDEPFYIMAQVMDTWSDDEAPFKWLCSCKGFRFSEENRCRHVLNMQRLLADVPSTPKGEEIVKTLRASLRERGEKRRKINGFRRTTSKVKSSKRGGSGRSMPTTRTISTRKSKRIGTRSSPQRGRRASQSTSSHSTTRQSNKRRP